MSIHIPIDADLTKQTRVRVVVDVYIKSPIIETILSIITAQAASADDDELAQLNAWAAA